MSVNYLYPGIVLHAPAPVLRRAAECNLLVVKEKVLVHSTQLGHHPRVYQHASPSDPIHRPGSNSPTSLVFPTGARYELLGDCSPEAGEGADGALCRAVGILQCEADDPGWFARLPLDPLDPLDHLVDQSTRDLHIRIQHEQPA